MRRQEGGDPGVYNQKTPTTILLTPEGAFHSFGYAARDAYHDLDHKDAQKWMYFDRFKMLLHKDEVLKRLIWYNFEFGSPIPPKNASSII